MPDEITARQVRAYLLNQQGWVYHAPRQIPADEWQYTHPNLDGSVWLKKHNPEGFIPNIAAAESKSIDEIRRQIRDTEPGHT